MKKKLETIQCLNNEATANQFPRLNSTKHDDVKNNEKCQRIVCNEESNDNILKKYEFSYIFLSIYIFTPMYAYMCIQITIHISIYGVYFISD